MLIFKLFFWFSNITNLLIRKTSILSSSIEAVYFMWQLSPHSIYSSYCFLFALFNHDELIVLLVVATSIFAIEAI